MNYPITLDAAVPSFVDMLFFSPLPLLIGISIVLIALFFIIRSVKNKKK